MIQCPRCGIQVAELISLEPEFIQKAEAVAGSNIPPQICIGCQNELRKAAAATAGGILMQQEKAKEENRLMMWKNRVLLIKKARSNLSQKRFSEAAVAYEKYLKILDIVFEVKKGDSLRPEIFKDNARTTELTVVASVYWDLMRIYDSNSKYLDRMNNCAKQLALFVQFTPIYPDIIRKAEAFQKSAKNPQVVRLFLKLSDKQRPRCFIATSAFLAPRAPEILALRNFRDTHLRKSGWGRKFIAIYYRQSPKLACLLDKHEWLKPFVRAGLRALIKCVS